jgi:hypothetical protein
MKTFILILTFLIGLIFFNEASKKIPMENIQKIEIKQDTVKKKLTDSQRKDLEYKGWQTRSKKMDFNMQKMVRQGIVMDSLLGKKDTTKIKK